MPEEAKEVPCLRRATVMTMDDYAYIVPRAKKYGTPLPEDETTVNIKDGRLVRCPNPECLSIELKGPLGWPAILPGRS